MAADLRAGERAEQEVHTGMGIAEQAFHARRRAAQQVLAERNVEDKRGQTGLKGERRTHNAKADCPAIRGKKKGGGHDENDAKQAVGDVHRPRVSKKHAESVRKPKGAHS